ncbi:Ankyrin-3 [Morella rubra]|uniref:Ankyrin-3 n=1 Tax=Morella rubra TaxID=262757 RepID=A0A6A1VQH9_9ROSI|nr:Ankyrin-3 [Morella rubra]KAB1215043.1 Ankyrin-3 [Morella rubra]
MPTTPQMDQSLMDAAQQGDIEFLYSAILGDPKVLDVIDEIPFAETPLHTAASAGQTHFALEIMILKPSFARKLNQHGLTPMHLALQYDQIEVVLRLLDVDKDLVRVPGRGGLTPLHYAAEKGFLDVLAEFLCVCPESIQDVTIQRETALHIALKEDMFDAFELLVGWLRRAWSINAYSRQQICLNWKDADAIMHLYIMQGVRLLLACGAKVNAKNSGGCTALDVLQGDNREIRNLLRRARALRASSLPTVPSFNEFLLSPPSWLDKIQIELFRAGNVTIEMRNALLVVGALLVTISYQAALSPPGGVWQDNYNPGTDQQINSTALINSNSSEVDQTPHQAGKLIMDPPESFSFFLINNLTFYFANCLLIMLLPDCLIKVMFLSLLVYLCLSYNSAMNIILPSASGIVLDELAILNLGIPALLFLRRRLRREFNQALYRLGGNVPFELHR